MKWPDLRHLDGYLPADMERAYRRHYLKDDTRTAIITMSFLCILLVAFAFNDYLLFDLTTRFYLLITLRTAYLIYFIVLIVFFRRNTSPRKYDINLLVWLVMSTIMVSIINLTRPASYGGNFLIDVILILLVYLCMPMRLAFRAAGAIAFTLVDIYIFFVLRWAIDTPIMAYTAIFSLLAANIGGLFASGLLYSFRRREFQARREREIIADQWQTTFDSITDMISIQDKDFRLVRVNRAYADLFGKKPEELVGRHCYEIVHQTSQPVDNCPHGQTMQTLKTVTEEVAEPRLGVVLEVTTSPIINGDGEIVGTVHLAKDISERKRLQEKLEKLSTHDFLTGLPNRLLLIDRFSIASAHALRHGDKLALMSLDLDKFKQINDTMGHAAGDQVLKAVAERLRGAVRGDDTVVRMGGDEFVVLMRDTGKPKDIVRMCQRIQQAFVKPINVEGEEVHTAASIGIAIFPDQGTELDELSKKSDQAMYEAKNAGRNRYTFYK